MEHIAVFSKGRTAACLFATILTLLPLASCKDSEDTPVTPDKPTEETDTVDQKVIAETPHVDIEAEGGKAYVFIKVYRTLYGLPQGPKLSVDAAWVKEESHQMRGESPQFADAKGSRAVYRGYYDMVYVLDVDKNEGLGREATITFNYYKDGGLHLGKPVKVTLHQWPRNLKSSETINVGHPGQLPVLMGGNVAAWSNLTSLKLTGQLNTADMRTLRLLLKRSVRSMTTYRDANGGKVEISTASTMDLRQLDMGDCELVEDGDTAVEECIEDVDRSYVQRRNVLGDRAFLVAGCKLDSIVLPKSLTEIGHDAFRMCGNLSYIDIPATVTTIGSYAFQNCTGMKEIRIPENSALKSLGVYALATGSGLNTITFPASLEVVENNGILGNVAAKNIHVKWPVPPVLSRFRISDKITLWVPKGSGDAYKAAFGWNQAKEIKEE